MKVRLVAMLVLWSMGLSAYAQTWSAEPGVTRNSDGALVITAKTIRPLQQILECVRRRYGWTVDYEEPMDARVAQFAGRSKAVNGGIFVARIHEPSSNTSTEKLRVLRDIVTQYNAQSAVSYRALQVSRDRFDVVPVNGSVLDLPSKSTRLRDRSVARSMPFSLPCPPHTESRSSEAASSTMPWS